MSWVHEMLARLPFDWAGYEFMRNAFLAVVLASPLFGLLGTAVVNNRMAFFSEALGHASLTGVGLGVILGLANPLPALAAFTLLLGWSMVALRRFSRAPQDTVISLSMSFSIALGVVVLSRGGGFARYTNFLIGDPLSVNTADIPLLALATAVLGGSMLLIYNRLLLCGLHASLAASRGVAVGRVQVVFVTALVLAVVLHLSWIGLLLINSLLVLPAAAARNLASSARQYVAWATAIALGSGVAGLLLAFYLETAASATIALLAVGIFLASLAFRRR